MRVTYGRERGSPPCCTTANTAPRTRGPLRHLCPDRTMPAVSAHMPDLPRDQVSSGGIDRPELHWGRARGLAPLNE